MKRSLRLRHLVAATLSILLGASCAPPPDAGEEQRPLEGLRPVYVASFARAPTAEEIQAEYLRFISGGRGAAGSQTQLVNPTNPATPTQGRKLVTLEVFTADETNAGTDEAGDIYFESTWNTASPASSYTERFVLDKSGRDDLDRGDFNVFYYLLTLGNYVSGATVNTEETFTQALIGTTTTDAWKCSAITLIDHNYWLESRSQSLPFNQWLDYPGSGNPPISGSVIRSPALRGTDGRAMSY